MGLLQWPLATLSRFRTNRENALAPVTPKLGFRSIVEDARIVAVSGGHDIGTGLPGLHLLLGNYRIVFVLCFSVE